MPSGTRQRLVAVPTSANAGLPAEAPRGKAGFTLVEMLVSMTLLIIFGTVAIETLRYGTDLWRAGHRRAFAYDTATIVFRQLEDDVSSAKSQFWCKDADSFDKRVKFWVDYDRFYELHYSDTDWRHGRQRLRFVRGIPDDVLNPRIRQAGDGVDNDNDGKTDEEYYNLVDDDDDGLIDEDLMPLEGMCEVAYLRGLEADDADTLYRAVQAPIGCKPNGQDSYSRTSEDRSGWTFFDEHTFDTSARIRGTPTEPGKARPLTENVLHFEIRCWTQYTTTWDDAVAFNVWPDSYTPQPCGPSFWWDSDRLASASATWSPWFVMDWGEPDFSLTGDADGDGVPNSQDEDYVEGNIFPGAIMVVVVTTPPANLRRIGAVRLAGNVAAGDTAIRVAGELPKYNDRWPYMRIGDEWIRFDGFDKATQTFTGLTRGARDTTAADHSARDAVEFGYTFSRVFLNPAGKTYW
jgi:hypothetical protein